jgi:ABC-type proline/glycine betaine transport system permease subunit
MDAMMIIQLVVCYAVGTLFGFWTSRSYWMTRGASKLYDIMQEKGLIDNDG